MQVGSTTPILWGGSLAIFVAVSIYSGTNAEMITLFCKTKASFLFFVVLFSII